LAPTWIGFPESAPVTTKGYSLIGISLNRTWQGRFPQRGKVGFAALGNVRG